MSYLLSIQEYYEKIKETILNANDKITNIFTIILSISFFLLIIEIILLICKKIEKTRRK